MRIDEIIAESLRTGLDITPNGQREWALFACALKYLKYDENTFVELSRLHGTNERESRKAWRAANVRYIKSEDQAKRKIAYFAKCAGLNIKGRGRDETPARRRQGVATPPPPQLPPVYIDANFIMGANRKFRLSALFIFISSIFTRQEVERAFIRYYIGSTKEFGRWPGSMGTAFPYIDREGKVIDVKLMAYDDRGKRLKNGYSANWLLAKIKMNDRRGQWPMFGEHLLRFRPSAPVGVVESEKTALIASIALPDYLWVATGSKYNLTPERCRALRERSVYLFPDADAADDWKQRGKELAKLGFSVYDCGKWIKGLAMNPKDDLADLIIRLRNQK